MMYPRTTPARPSAQSAFRASNAVKFGLVFCVVNLHTLRSLSDLFYLAMYVPTATVVATQFLIRYKKRILRGNGALFYVWIFLAFLAFAVSMLTISAGAAIYGLIRFLFAAPIFMALVLYTADEYDLRKHIRTAVVFFAIASLTLPLQFVVGPISWFAESSTRAGFDRYSTLVGSLTAMGIIVGSYMLLAQGMTSSRRWLWVSFTALAATASLSKSAIANVAVAAILLIYLNRKSLGRLP